jgi:hypothetical protein
MDHLHAGQQDALKWQLSHCRQSGLSSCQQTSSLAKQADGVFVVIRIVQVLSLKRQLQLLLQRHAERSENVAAAADVLDGLRRRQHRALHDVEVQLKLKQGQVCTCTSLRWTAFALSVAHVAVVELLSSPACSTALLADQVASRCVLF